MEAERLILATWAAASVFVGWLALVSVVRRSSTRTTAPEPDLPMEDAPPPTPEEIAEAQAMGILPLPSTPDPGASSRGY